MLRIHSCVSVLVCVCTVRGECVRACVLHIFVCTCVCIACLYVRAWILHIRGERVCVCP